MDTWKKYGIEFLSIFIAVISAFALNNWNDSRKSNIAEEKILTEIYDGLKKDLIDITENVNGHKQGVKAVIYFRNLIAKKKVDHDSLPQYYFTLTRNFFLLQNTSGYETLKSRGLEIIGDDALRSSIISMYEYDYNILKKLEEEYSEMQFHEHYFKEINQILTRSFIFDKDKKNIIDIETPLKISKNEEKKLLTYLWKIQMNRKFTLQCYEQTKEKIEKIIKKNQKK